MPKQVDYAERRRRIAEAVCRLVAAHGPQAVTLRDVAARAEVSLGAVQRCFRDKDEMLRFAVDHVGERVTARVRDRLAASPARSAVTALGHAAEEVALLREERRAEARTWLAFVAQAAVSEPLARSLRGSYAALENLVVRLVTEAAGTTGPRTPADIPAGARTGAPADSPGGSPADTPAPARSPGGAPADGSAPPPGPHTGVPALDARREARTLLALTDGLTTHVLVGHLTPAEAEDVLRTHLTALWRRLEATDEATDET